MIRLAVRCRREAAGEVLAELLELAPGGVEENEEGDQVEFAIYGGPGELPELGALEAAAGAALVEVTSTEVPDDWADRWRDFHTSLLVAERLLVRPSWEPAAEADGVIDVVIDPGVGFGTGAHPTTRMCLELLVELADRGLARGEIADWGTGSGVLAIAAAKLGFSPVSAYDNEVAAVDCAAENAGANGVTIATERLNLREQPPPCPETVVANLTGPLLRGVVASIDEPPARMVCSGFLPSEADGVAEAMKEAGLREAERRSGGEWCAGLYERR